MLQHSEEGERSWPVPGRFDDSSHSPRPKGHHCVPLGLSGPHLRRLQAFQRLELHYSGEIPVSDAFGDCGNTYMGVQGEVYRAVNPLEDDPWRALWRGVVSCTYWECVYCSRGRAMATGANVEALSSWMTGDATSKWGLAKVVGWAARAQRLRPLFWTATLPGVPGRTVGEGLKVHLKIMRTLSTGKTRRRLGFEGVAAAFRKFDDTLSTRSGYFNRHVHQHGIMWVQGLSASDVNRLVQPYVVRAIERLTGKEARPDLAFRAEEPRSDGVYQYAVGGLQEVDGSLLDPAVLETVGVAKQSAKGSWNLQEALADLEAGCLDAETDSELRSWYVERWNGYQNRQRVGLLTWTPGTKGAWQNIGTVLDVPDGLRTSSLEAIRSVYSRSRRERMVMGHTPDGEPKVIERLRSSRDTAFKRRMLEDGWRLFARTCEFNRTEWAWLRGDSSRLFMAERLMIEAAAAAVDLETGEVADPDWSALVAYVERRGGR